MIRQLRHVPDAPAAAAPVHPPLVLHKRVVLYVLTLGVGAPAFAARARDVAELKGVPGAHHVEDLVVSDLLEDLVALGVLEEGHAVVGDRAE